MTPPTRLPPLRTLVAFEAVARLGSVSAAAETLNLTQSAVSHQLRQLEGWFGRQLFERGPRGLVATAEAAELTAKVRAALGLLGDGVAALEASGPRSLRIGATTSFFRKVMTPAVPMLTAALADQPLSFLIVGFDEDFSTMGLDLAVLLAPRDRVPRGARNSRHLTGETLFPVASPDWVAARGGVDGFAPSMLGPADLIGCGHDGVYWERWLEAAGHPIRPAPPILWPSIADMLEAAARGEGVALAGDPHSGPDIRSGCLVALPGPVLDSGYDYHAVWTERLEHDPRLGPLLDWLAAACVAAAVP